MALDIAQPRSTPPLVVHIIHRLAAGGMENGLVNLINHMPGERYRHAIVSLTDATDFRERIRRPDVPVISLHRQPGRDYGVHRRVWQTLRRMRPAIVHTRNLAALECLVSAGLAGVPGRVHGEHGRDMYDLDGVNAKYRLLRKAIRPLAQRYIAVSRDLAQWLVRTIGIRPERVAQIDNGVDVSRFRPRTGSRVSIGPDGFVGSETFVIGSVGRMEPVKDPLTLARAFAHLITVDPGARERARLVMIGGGSLLAEVREVLRRGGAEHLAWLPGEREDIPELMQGMDLFALTSLREGISNTILEAMASGLPVVATSVGGTPELVVADETGTLVAPSDPVALADVISGYVGDAARSSRHGDAGRRRVHSRFSLTAMVDGYLAVYDGIVKNRRCAPSPAA